MIKEIIVVEGKDDISAVKRAVEAELIATGGFALPPAVLQRIRAAAEKQGVIILTDPDYAGEKIRKTISQQIPGCKHAFIPRDEATRNQDIGVENASPASIIAALEKVRGQLVEKRTEFTQADLVHNGLLGTPAAAERRDLLGRILGIGYGNAKQFLSRLNHYGVTREEFQEALSRLFEREGANG